MGLIDLILVLDMRNSIVFKCNRAKDTMSSEEFIDHIERIHNHIFSEGSTTIPKGSTLEMYAGGKGASPHLIE